MFGTVAKVRVAPDKFDDLTAILAEWERDFRPKVRGAMGSVAYRLDADPDTVILCAVFEDRAAYEANADNPEQDKWYRRFRACLAADPEWMDGAVFANSF